MEEKMSDGPNAGRITPKPAMSKIKRLQQALAAEREKVTRREEAIDGMKRTIDANRELLAAEQERAETLEKNAKAEHRAFEALIDYRNDLYRRIRGIKAQRDDAIKRAEAAEAKLETALQQRGDAIDAKFAAEAENAELRGEVERLERELTAKQDEHDSAFAEASDYQKRLDRVVKLLVGDGTVRWSNVVAALAAARGEKP
jgi:chromosome segregation ATPase